MMDLSPCVKSSNVKWLLNNNTDLITTVKSLTVNVQLPHKNVKVLGLVLKSLNTLQNISLNITPMVMLLLLKLMVWNILTSTI